MFHKNKLGVLILSAVMIVLSACGKAATDAPVAPTQSTDSDYATDANVNIENYDTVDQSVSDTTSDEMTEAELETDYEENLKEEVVEENLNDGPIFFSTFFNF